MTTKAFAYTHGDIICEAQSDGHPLVRMAGQAVVILLLDLGRQVGIHLAGIEIVVGRPCRARQDSGRGHCTRPQGEGKGTCAHRLHHSRQQLQSPRPYRMRVIRVRIRQPGQSPKDAGAMTVVLAQLRLTCNIHRTGGLRLVKKACRCARTGGRRRTSYRADCKLQVVYVPLLGLQLGGRGGDWRRSGCLGTAQSGCGEYPPEIDSLPRSITPGEGATASRECDLGLGQRLSSSFSSPACLLRAVEN